MFLDRAKAQLEQTHTIRPDRFRPCTEEEVRTLEKWVGLSLPLAYKEFLLWMGHGAGSFLSGSDCFYYSLTTIQQSGRRLLKENNFPEFLPDDAFVIFMHQGYNFGFFRVCEGADPPVYWYSEMDEQETFTLRYAHYSDFLLAEIESSAKIVAQIAAHYAERELASGELTPDLADDVKYYLAKDHP